MDDPYTRSPMFPGSPHALTQSHNEIHTANAKLPYQELHGICQMGYGLNSLKGVV